MGLGVERPLDTTFPRFKITRYGQSELIFISVERVVANLIFKVELLLARGASQHTPTLPVNCENSTRRALSGSDGLVIPNCVPTA